MKKQEKNCEECGLTYDTIKGSLQKDKWFMCVDGKPHDFGDATPTQTDWEENDEPEISKKDFEDMYISQGRNQTEKMERRFKVWLENRDDDFEIDIWQFRCLQDFIHSELSKAYAQGKEEIKKEIADKIKEGKKITRPIGCPDGQIGCAVYHTETVTVSYSAKEIIDLISLNNEEKR